MSRWQISAVGVAAIAIGIICGLLIPQGGIRSAITAWLAGDAIDVSESDEEEAADTGIFAISKAAQQTFGLKVEKVKSESFTQNLRVPAFVRERPSVSNLSASSSLQGIVRRVLVQTGQSVREGDPLIELELTGDELAVAQASLLDSVQELRIIEDDIKRLRPAAEEGGIARKSLIDREYEQRRTLARIETRRQELLVRGLSTDDILQIIEQQQLVRSKVIRVPAGIIPRLESGPVTESHESNRNDPITPASSSKNLAADAWAYSVEDLLFGWNRR